MEHDEIYYRRHLPHFQPGDATFFVTFRLAGSLPLEAVAQLKRERWAEEKEAQAVTDQKRRHEQLYQVRKRYFGKFDYLLDHSQTGPRWLSQPEIANLVADALFYRDGKVFKLLAFTIMPNHVHTVFYVGPTTRPSSRGKRASPHAVTEILENLKWYTALRANQLLNRTGQFWQHESYDHVVRDEGELARIVWYVAHNPVKAGLAERWKDWKWTYVLEELAADLLD